MVVLYGDKYIGSAIYFRMMLTLSFFHVIAYGPFVINIGRVKYYANAHCITAIVVILLDSLCVYFFKSPTNIMAISILCRIGLVIAMLMLIRNVLRVKLIDLFPVADMLKIIGIALPLLYCLRICLLIYFELPPLTTMVVSGIIFALAFGILSLPLKLNYVSIVKTILKK